MNDSNKGSNGPAGSRSGKLHSEERDGLSVTGPGRSPARFALACGGTSWAVSRESVTVCVLSRFVLNTLLLLERESSKLQNFQLSFRWAVTTFDDTELFQHRTNL